MTNGITVSQEGIDVRQALDSQKVLDSRWRYFEIAFEVDMSLPPSIVYSSGKSIDVFTHGLGFLPAFDCYDITSGAYIDFDAGVGMASDTDKIYLMIESLTNRSNHKILLRIYNVPITEEYEAPIRQTFPSKKSAPNGIGVKINDGSGEFDSSDIRKYPLTTSAKALAIQKTGIVVATGTATITHGLGNPPLFLAAYAGPSYVGALNPGKMPFMARSTGDTVTLIPAQNTIVGPIAYIVFKDFGEIAI